MADVSFLLLGRLLYSFLCQYCWLQLLCFCVEYTSFRVDVVVGDCMRHSLIWLDYFFVLLLLILIVLYL